MRDRCSNRKPGTHATTLKARGAVFANCEDRPCLAPGKAGFQASATRPAADEHQGGSLLSFYADKRGVLLSDSKLTTSLAVRWVLGAALVGAACCCQICWCQQASSSLSARTLFYSEQPPDSGQLPPISQRPKKTATASSAQNASTATHKANTANQSLAGGQSAFTPVVQHLGLRYNLVLFGSDGRAEPVKSERNFRPGECFAIELEANRSGYLFVLDQGSSGQWKPLLPSEKFPDEPNIVESRTPVRVPQKHCISIENPAGVDKLVVVLSRSPDELYDLNQSIKETFQDNKADDMVASSPVPGRAARTLEAQAHLDQEVGRIIGTGLQSRDLEIKEIPKPERDDEPPHAVYIVHKSSVPSNRVVAEIKIHHE
jgi:hypothetical protein